MTLSDPLASLDFWAAILAVLKAAELVLQYYVNHRGADDAKK